MARSPVPPELLLERRHPSRAERSRAHAAEPTVASAAHPVIALQRSIGNRTVTGLLRHPARLSRAPAEHSDVVAAGLAATSPQEELSGQLHDELRRIANARAVVAFIRAQRTSAGLPSTVNLTSLLADARTVKGMHPRPRSVADLQPTIELLMFYGVVAGGGPTLDVRLDPSTGDVDTTKLDHAAGSIAHVSEDFDSRAAAKDPINPIGQTGLIDITDAAGAAAEKKADREAERTVEDVKAQLAEHVVVRTPGPDGKPRRPITRVTVDALPPPVRSAAGVDVLQLPVAGSTKPVELPAADVVRIESVAGGTDQATVKLREKLIAALEKATKRMRAAQGYRAFASSVVDFLTRLRARNGRFVAGTYPRHVWAEYSVDVFLTVSEDADGFYKRPETERFLDDVNATALDSGGPYGAFQWHAVYNDAQIADTINAKYGAGRMHRLPHHGPAPDKLHIHLDLRPATLTPDNVSGFRIGPDGRVRVP
jgi:hypothetical protein